MTSVKRVENQIFKIEKFRAQFQHPKSADYRDVRGDRGRMPSWPYKYKANGDISISSWKYGRFKRTYPGFTVKVLDGRTGVPFVGARRSLRSVRKTYES